MSARRLANSAYYHPAEAWPWRLGLTAYFAAKLCHALCIGAELRPLSREQRQRLSTPIGALTLRRSSSGSPSLLRSPAACQRWRNIQTTAGIQRAQISPPIYSRRAVGPCNRRAAENSRRFIQRHRGKSRRRGRKAACRTKLNAASQPSAVAMSHLGLGRLGKCWVENKSALSERPA